MEIVSLTVDQRSDVGKGPARRARASGKVLGIFYGPNQKTAVTLQLDEKEFAKKLAVLEGSHLIQFDSPAAELKSRMVLLREVQSHPVSGKVLHADFYEVDLTKKLEVSVALHFTGKPVGVEAGGILQPIVREVTVKCLPTEIPAFLSVDVSQLGIHDSIHIEELTLPAGAELVYDTNFTVVTVSPPTVEEVKVEAPVEGVPVEGVAAAPAEGAAAQPAPEAKPAEAAKKGEKGE
ncbi:MAG: 50S ribosomal protein L25 [Candidatus Binatia bacterium]